MRIGILTQPLRHNYGGTLQNFALQHVLTEFGHEVQTINWGIDHSWIKWIIHFIAGSFGKEPCPKSPYHDQKEEIFFRRFHDSYIKRTKPIGKLSATVFVKRHYDMYVVGSDQVWRKDFNANLAYMYLSSVDDCVPRIAYAASLGIDQWDYPPMLTAQVKPLARKFKAISVREHNAVSLLKEALGVSSELVLDPTLLLSLSDYERLLNLSPKKSSKYIAVYILDMTPSLQTLITELSHDTGFKIKVIGSKTYEDDFLSAKTNTCPSIESWLEAIRDAEILITDSFHGTAFSINFNVNFVSIGNAHRGNSRFNSLLSMFGLTDRLVCSPSSTDAILRILRIPIDWNAVNSVKNEMLEKSMKFLKNNIQ